MQKNIQGTNTLTIACLNAACTSEENLKCSGDAVLRTWLLLRKYADKDLIAVTEISHNSLKKITKMLPDHALLLDTSWDTVPPHNRYRYKALTALFVKRIIGFDQMAVGGFQTTLRSVYGSLMIGNEKVYLKASHVPCVLDTDNPAQISRKKQMLEVELADQQKWIANGAVALSMGDFNGSRSKQNLFACQEIFNQIPCKGLIDEYTFVSGSKPCQLDNIYVTPKAEELFELDVETDKEPFGTLTDHLPICLTVNLKH